MFTPNNQQNHKRTNESPPFEAISPSPTTPMLFGCHTSTGSYVHKNDILSFEMSMKTVEMCALINGTTPQEAYLQYLAGKNEGERHRLHFRAASHDDDCLVDSNSLLRLVIVLPTSQEETDCDGEIGVDETEDMFIIDL